MSKQVMAISSTARLTNTDSGDEAAAYTLIDTENAIIGQRLQQVRDDQWPMDVFRYVRKTA